MHMAANEEKEVKNEGVRRVSFVPIQKLQAGVMLLSLSVVIIGGVLARVSIGTILFRATVVALVLFIVGRVVLRALTTYEEMNGG
jgi:hypothetical protein